MPFGMCPYLFQGAGGDDGAIPADVVVITDAMEATAAMFRFQILCGKGMIRPGGATMHHN